MQAETELNGPLTNSAELARIEASGIRFLLGRQDPDGAWRDFQVKPGRSDAWVTSYVGAALLTMSNRNHEAIPAALASAVRFLGNARQKRGGWGYNRACDPDADSTARVILFLHGAEENVDLCDYSALASFQLEDGAFATYHYKNGWGSGHADVTAVALQALASILSYDHIILRKGYRRLKQFLLSKSPWRSYWWSSRFYLVRECLALRMKFLEAPEYSAQLPRLAPNASGFEQALALEASLMMGCASSRMQKRVQRLVAMQCADGGWPSAHILRVMHPDAKSPCDHLGRRSPVIPDDRRLFTTATVLRAFSLFRQAAMQGTIRQNGKRPARLSGSILRACSQSFDVR